MPATSATQEEKTGIVESFYAEDTGAIKEESTGTVREFYQKGASVEFKIGDSVRYTIITTPNGRVIVAGIKKPH